MLDRSILHGKANIHVFSKIYDGKIINIPYQVHWLLQSNHCILVQFCPKQ